jgi:hypothetical protein
MTATVTYPRAGQVEDGYEQYIDTIPADTPAMAAGLVGSIVSGELVLLDDDSGLRPFFLVVEDKALNITQARVLRWGIGYGIADGNIAVGTEVKAGDTTAGRIMQAVEGGTPTAANKRLGEYLGHPGEGSGNSPMTAATVGQVIKVFFK